MAKIVREGRWWRCLLVWGLLAAGFMVFGCGTSPRPEFAPRNDHSLLPQESRSATNRRDLSGDERRGGHTLERHVARTEEQLHERLEHEPNISAVSTWTDRETAETVVAEALAAERGRVENWMRRGYPRANLALHYNAGRVIGRSLRRGDSVSVDCTEAVIVLRADGPGDFYVLTSYPEARE